MGTRVVRGGSASDRPSVGLPFHSLVGPPRAAAEGLFNPGGLNQLSPEAYNSIDQLLDTGGAMPRYEYYCEDCKKPFEVILTIAEYEKAKVKCAKCGGNHVHQEPAAFFAVTSKKS